MTHDAAPPGRVEDNLLSEAIRQELEKALFYLIHTLPFPVFAFDSSRRVAAWSRDLELLTGLSGHEMMGKSEDECAVRFYGIQRPLLTRFIDDPDEVISEYYSHIRRTSASLSGEAFLPVPGRNQVHARIAVSRMFDREGGCIGVIEYLQDISELADSRQRIEEIENRYHGILEQSYDLISNYDKTFRLHSDAMELADLVYWEYDMASDLFTFDNRFYAMYGTSVENEGGNRMSSEGYASQFLHPDDMHLVSEEIEKARRTKDPTYRSRVEHRIIRRDGEIRYIMVRFGVVKDAQGRTVKTYGANQDITDRKKSELALKKANRQVNLLTSITRHDILNKISLILMYLDVARVECKDPLISEYIQLMDQATMAIKSQIEFTRIYNNLGVKEPEWQDLSTLFPLSQKHDRYTITVERQNIAVFADLLLKKVFFNLLDNSLRHGQHVSEIRVFTLESEGELIVVWEDNGIGIPEKEKELIFDRGYGKNTGLGMFLAREILSLTGITIYETGIQGKGARFEITVPKGGWRRIR